MIKNFVQTTFFKIYLGILITTLLVISIVGVISFQQVNKGFDTFINRQEEVFGPPWMRGAHMGQMQAQRRQEQLVDEYKDKVITAIVVSGIIGVFISLILAYIISKQVSSPLSTISNKLKVFSKGKYNERIHETGTLETKKVIKEFNNLLSELNKVENLREELISDISHELNTPVTKVKGILEGIQDGVYKPSEKNIQKAGKALGDLEYLIARLQEFAEVKGLKPSLETINLKEIVEESSSTLSKKNVSIKINIPDKLEIIADKYMLKQIINNILENAYKYTDNGTIKIFADARELKVEDTGIGINEKDLPYIFERFYRAEKSRNRKTGGLGLGLAITKDLIEAMGWAIEVESKTGKGTKFIIYYA